jgi:hypothetical protein
MKIGSQNSLKIILISLLIGLSIMFIFRPDGVSLLKLIAVSFILLPIVILIYFFYRNLYLFKKIHIYYKLTYSILLIWILFTIIRSINSNFSDMLTLFSNFRVGGIVWLTPLAIIYGLNIYNWKNLIEFIPKILFIGILFFFFSILIDNFNIYMAVKYWLLFFIFSSFIYFYYSNMNRIIIFISAILYVIISINISQRANFLFISIILLFTFFQYLKNKYVSIYKKVFILIIALLSSLLLVFIIPSYLNNLSKDKEASSDTRTFLFVELINDLKEEEVIIGKGALGSYYSPYFFKSRQYSKQLGKSYEGDSSTRSTSEVGYLFMLLKGGTIMIILHLLILIPAIYLGIFKSNNLLSKAFAYYILSYLLMWNVSYTTEFLPEFLLLWMAVGGSISKEIRNKTDLEIYQLLNQRN